MPSRKLMNDSWRPYTFLENPNLHAGGFNPALGPFLFNRIGTISGRQILESPETVPAQVPLCAGAVSFGARGGELGHLAIDGRNDGLAGKDRCGGRSDLSPIGAACWSQ
jgi:hypothetical protein